MDPPSNTWHADRGKPTSRQFRAGDWAQGANAEGVLLALIWARGGGGTKWRGRRLFCDTGAAGMYPRLFHTKFMLSKVDNLQMQ